MKKQKLIASTVVAGRVVRLAQSYPDEKKKIINNRSQSMRRLGALTATLALGVCVVAFLVVFSAQAAQSQTLTTLYNFTGGKDGGSPLAPAMRDLADHVFGTTSQGGGFGYGNIFEFDKKTGAYTVLYDFTGGQDGANAHSELVMADATKFPAHPLYGTTFSGGLYGQGVVFRISQTKKTVTETVLYTFTGGADGGNPDTGLLLDAKGNLFGTTHNGGDSGFGVVFEVNTVGAETVLHSFTGGADGANPYSATLINARNYLYGVTPYGGDTTCNAAGCGVVFKLGTDGTFTVLHSFAGGTKDGCNPFGDLVMDRSSNLYGTTSGCGSRGGGTVFKLDTRGVYTTLHSFTGGADGGVPTGVDIFCRRKPCQGSSLVIFGVTQNGGKNSAGTAFAMDVKGGHFQVLAAMSFFSNLFRGSGGDIEHDPSGHDSGCNGGVVSTTAGGGTYGFGTIWKLTNVCGKAARSREPKLR